MHGGLLDAGMWDEQFEMLSKQYRVIAMTLAVTALVDTHRRLLELRGCARAARDAWRAARHARGLSLGGRTAIDFALAYPAMVDAVVAVAPGLERLDFDDPVLAEHERGLKAAAAAQDRAMIVEWFQRSWTDGPKRTPQQVDPVCVSVCAHGA